MSLVVKQGVLAYIGLKKEKETPPEFTG